MKKIASLILVCLSALFSYSQCLERVAPEEVGLDAQQLQYADKAINEAIRQGTIPGAVLAVVRHGKMAYLQAYGNKRTYPKTEPMSIKTIFDLASCSKPVSTAIAVMQLIEQGKLRLLDPVNLYISGFQNWKDNGQEMIIRIEDLLTHTSGLPPYVSPDELISQYGKATPKNLIDYISACKRDFPPKSKFQYSCLNFIILQHLVEAISGQSLRDFSAEHIFRTLGMSHTDYLPIAQDGQGNWINTSDACWAKTGEDWQSLVAPTELQQNGQVLCGQVHDPLARVANGGISGNAGLFSNADDLAILCAALQNQGEWNGKRILSAAAVKTMITVPQHIKSFGRALGWDCFSAYSSNKGDLLSPHTYCHTGYTGTSIVIDPDNDISIILLTNHVHPKDGHSVVRLRSIVANVVAASMRIPCE